MAEDLHKDAQKKMDHTLEVFRRDLSSVRSNRASAGLLNPVQVEYYGTPTPLNQLATINTPDPQLITVTPYDKSIVKQVEKAIAAADLGLNPSADGPLIRVPIPPLTEERRRELAKHVKKIGEDCKIALRNIRREANDKAKKAEKNKELSQDEERTAEARIQEMTDAHVKRIDQMVQDKEKELMTV